MKVNTTWNLKKKEKKIPSVVAQGFEKTPKLVRQMLPSFKGCV